MSENERFSVGPTLPILIPAAVLAMNIVPFQSEWLLSIWQNHVQYDFTETGVYPLYLHGYLTRDEFNHLYDEVQLRYVQTNGTLPLKEPLCTLYDDVLPENILVTNGSAEANFVTLWRLSRANSELRRDGVLRNCQGLVGE